MKMIDNKITKVENFFDKYGLFTSIGTLYKDFMRMGIKIDKFYPDISIDKTVTTLHISIPEYYDNGFFKFIDDWNGKETDKSNAYTIFNIIGNFLVEKNVIQKPKKCCHKNDDFLFLFSSNYNIIWDEEKFFTTEYEFTKNPESFIRTSYERAFYDFIKNLNGGN